MVLPRKRQLVLPDEPTTLDISHVRLIPGPLSELNRARKAIPQAAVLHDASGLRQYHFEPQEGKITQPGSAEEIVTAVN